MTHKSYTNRAALTRWLLTDCIEQQLKMAMLKDLTTRSNGRSMALTHYLICLGLELLLKSAYVAYDGPTHKKQLLKIGHDLVLALEEAEKHGFNSKAPRIREITQILREPYMAHYFRYDRPEEIPLPDFVQMVEALQILDGELENIFYTAA